MFGVGRLSKIGGEMGSAIREFRDGLEGPEDEEAEEPTRTADGSPEEQV
ncbi:MAG: hypothetical protein R3191_05620 [Anaerolineales bacterium]|nr:hypothetical protein [Anaerolineales bacterium]